MLPPVFLGEKRERSLDKKGRKGESFSPTEAAVAPMTRVKREAGRWHHRLAGL